jgi:hypothetical protein
MVESSSLFRRMESGPRRGLAETGSLYSEASCGIFLNATTTAAATSAILMY